MLGLWFRLWCVSWQLAHIAAMSATAASVLLAVCAEVTPFARACAHSFVAVWGVISVFVFMC